MLERAEDGTVLRGPAWLPNQAFRIGSSAPPIRLEDVATSSRRVGDKRVSSFSERAFDRHTPLQGPADLYHADCAHGIA